MLLIAVLVSTVFLIGVRVYYGSKISPLEMVVQLLVATAISGGFLYSLQYVDAVDYEILNGEVTSKDAITKDCRRSWSRSKDSFCLTHYSKSVYDGESCTGSGRDRRCHSKYHTEYKPKYAWETRYFVEHSFSTVEFGREDDRGINVPPLFAKAYVGQPVAYPHQYMNWIKGASNSLFHEETLSLDAYQDVIPPYPNSYYDIYKVDRFVEVGLKLPNSQEINLKLAEALKVLGPQRQMNAIIVAVNVDTYSGLQTASTSQGSNSAVSSSVETSKVSSPTSIGQDFPFAVRRAWKGFEKNDAVVFVGVDSSLNLRWVNILSWSKNEMFNVDLRERLLQGINKPVDFVQVVSTLKEVGMSSYERRSMKEFEYLKDQVPTPTWVYVCGILINILLSLGLGFLFQRIELESIFSSSPMRKF